MKEQEQKIRDFYEKRILSAEHQAGYDVKYLLSLLNREREQKTELLRVLGAAIRLLDVDVLNSEVVAELQALITKHKEQV